MACVLRLTDMVYVQVLGNGMFVFAFIQGMVAVVSPFTVHPYEYMRDCSFYLLANLLIALCLFDGRYARTNVE